MSAGPKYIPVYQCLGPRDIWTNGAENYRSTFPFCSEHGHWTFNGRSALHVGLSGLGLPPGSTVLVPNYFQGVEIDTLIHDGYRLEFYRVSPSSLEVDLDDVEEKLTPKVSALYIIHYFGWPQPLASITGFCETHGLKLIEDCALSLFSRAGDDWLGTRGDMSIFSVYKTLPLPHGGYLVNPAPGRADAMTPPPFMSTLRQLVDLVMEDFRHKGWHRAENIAKRISRAVRTLLPRRYSGHDIGSGGATWDPRLVDYGASSLIRRLVRNADPTHVIETRRRNFSLLHDRLRDRFEFPLPELPAGACPLFYPVMVEDKSEVMKRLAARRVGSVNLWWDEHPACPEELGREVTHLRRHLLELPIHQSLTEDDVAWVADAFLEVGG